MKTRTMGMAAAAWLLAIGMAAAAPAPDSKRMGRAKDFIADEQWSRAIVELQAAAEDPKESNRDEALFWLAHSQHQVGDDSAALQTIATLERTAPTSRWKKPAQSLRVEIAQRLRRDDVLWMIGAPPALPATPAVPPQPMPPGAAPRPVSAPRPGAPVPATPPAIATPAGPPLPAPAPPPAVPVPPWATPQVIQLRPAGRGVPTPPVPPGAPAPWGAEIWLPPSPEAQDITIKVQALTGLLEAHGDQVIPLLRAIALDRGSPDEARMAVFALGQSRRPEAQRTVVEVARDGSEPVRIAAVRELGRFDGPMISTELMRVYTMANTPPRLKRQVVSSLGERADSALLLRIVKSESEPAVRDYAIVTLGRTGARDQLRLLYPQTPRVSRPAVLTALFTARDDDELIRIAQRERDPALRARARQQLRMLATPKALKFLEENP
jgi:hypothetical protein